MNKKWVWPNRNNVVLGAYGKVLYNRANSANVFENDEFEIITVNPNLSIVGRMLKNRSVWNFSRENYMILDKTKMEDTKLKKIKLAKHEELVKTLDKSNIGRKVAILQAGDFCDLHFDGGETGVIVDISDNYGGSYYINWNNTFNGGRAYVSPEYLKFVNDLVAAKSTKSKRRLSKKDAAIMAKPVVDASVEYVRIIASQLGIDVTMMSDVEYHQLISISDKNEINGLLFAWRDNAAKTIKISDKTESLLKSVKSKDLDARVNKIKANIRQYSEDVDNYLYQMNESLSKLTKQRHELELITKDSSKSILFEEVKEIIKSGWWKFEESLSKLNPTSGDVILTFSTKDVNINQSHSEFGVNTNLNMGQYYVDYNYNQGTIKVRAKANNLIRGSTIHPHISGGPDGASVCWGNSQQTVVDALKAGKPAKAFESLQIILQTYGGNPYVSVSEFKSIHRRLNTSIPDENGDSFLPTNYIYRIRREFIPAHLLESIDVDKSNTNDRHVSFRVWKNHHGVVGYVKGNNSTTVYNISDLTLCDHVSTLIAN